ncbi:MAG: SET domain-containing protein-lysine N-methyltransferase [Saprospiraceae bacterium]
MIHPDTFVRPTHKGLGLFAKRPFRKGEIIWIADDLDLKIPVLDYMAFEENTRTVLNRYSYLDYQNRVIVPWDSGKYVNHSCAPNSTGLLEFDNISIALRDIRSGEEIMEDYCCYYGHFETFTCLCGQPNCRGEIGHDNSYDPGLRLRLAEIAPELLAQKQVLLDYHFEENRIFMDMLATLAFGYPKAG